MADDLPAAPMADPAAHGEGAASVASGGEPDIPMQPVPCGNGAPVSAAHARRAAARGQLRADLQAARAKLRVDRACAAVAAATRPPRWRATRTAAAHGTPPSPPKNEPAAPPQPRLAAPVPVPPNVQATDCTYGAASSIFAALLGDLDASAKPPGDPRAQSGCSADDAITARRVNPSSPALVPAPAASTAAADPQASRETPPPRDAPVTIAALGPAMLARLRKLGYARFTDLATARPEALRTSLGDRDRLLDIDGWIDAARRLAENEARHRSENQPAAAGPKCGS